MGLCSRHGYFKQQPGKWPVSWGVGWAGAQWVNGPGLLCAVQADTDFVRQPCIIIMLSFLS